MRWQQWNGFHKSTYSERYPFTYARLKALDIGDFAGLSMIQTVDALLDYVDQLHQRIDQLEIEKDLV